jgi:hypothetical protein
VLSFQSIQGASPLITPAEPALIFTWARELDKVKSIREKYASGTDVTAHYVCCFHAFCTDDSHQRHLLCLPNERFRVDVVVSAVDCNRIGNLVELVIVGADGIRSLEVFVRVENNRAESVLQSLELRAPLPCGLYQICSCVSISRGIGSSGSTTTPSSTSSTFVAWLTVAEIVEVRGPGPMAKIDFGAVLGIDVDPIDILNGAWEGSWTKQNTSWRYHVTLFVDVDRSTATVTGRMVWNVIEHDASAVATRNYVGLCAVEHIKGTFSSNDYALRYDGISREDPLTIIAVDKYNLNLNALAKELGGKTATSEGNWSGRLTLKKQTDIVVRFLSGTWIGSWLVNAVSYVAHCTLATTGSMESVGTAKLFLPQSAGDKDGGQLYKEYILNGRYDMERSSFRLKLGMPHDEVQLFYGLKGPAMTNSSSSISLVKV